MKYIGDLKPNLNSPTLNSSVIKSNTTLKNDTEEDSDGGRESKVIFSGEQSGGEITTLAEIEASHDGTSDDQKGDLILRTNDGNDGTSPTERLRINSAGDMLFSSEDPSLTIANTTHEDTDGGRESTIVFQGEQSGGEVSTLAQIEAAHDGTADDQKGDLIFRTNDGSDGTSPTEVLRIDSAGRVGVGTNPAAITDSAGVRNIQLGATFLSHFTPDQDGTTAISNNVYWDGSNNKALFTGPSTSYLQTDRSHRFRTAASVSAGANAGIVESVRIDNEGIKFNGDTSVDNALDDYEEGSFTPVISWATPSNGSVSYVARTGYYIKVGRSVTIHLEVRINLISQNSATLPMLISGFPYNFHNTGGYGGSLMKLSLYGFTFTSGHIPFGWGLFNSDKLYLYTMASGSAIGNLATPPNYQSINVSGTYITPT